MSRKEADIVRITDLEWMNVLDIIVYPERKRNTLNGQLRYVKIKNPDRNYRRITEDNKILVIRTK